MKKYIVGICLVYSLIVMAAASQVSAETLTITITGTGRGIVSADTGTILWSGLTGTSDYSLSTAVTLTALPNEGVSFMGWSGSCTGTGACALTMDTAMSVTALFSAVPQTGQTIVYALGDDGAIQAGVAWPDPRFTVSSSGTGTVVTDSLTGLIWPQDGGTPTVGACTGGDLTWQGALDYVACLNTNNYLGYNDWRLPNINELESLVNEGQAPVAGWLNTQGFTNVRAYYSYYWSSTTDAGVTTYAWYVNMYDGDVFTNLKTFGFYAWPVRGGQSGAVNLPQTGQSAVYATGDDGSLQKGVAWPSPRFTVTSSGTGTVVRDNLTGLVWPRDGGTPTVGSCRGGALTWQGALDYVACLNMNNYLDHNDWRLPNKNELRSLANYESPDVADWLNTQGFTKVQVDEYWSSSTHADNTASAWGIYMYAEVDWPAIDKSAIYYTWPVRGGQPRAFGNSVILIVSKYGTGSGSVAADSDTFLWTGAMGTARYSLNTSVTLSATADSGSTFTGWSGACSGTGACTVTMNAAKSVTAMFNPTGYVTVLPVFVGLGTMSPGTNQQVAIGKTMKFKIKPDKGYHIGTVTGCNNGTLSGSIYTTGPITETCTVTAVFAVNSYAVTSKVRGNGGISAGQSVDYNNTTSFAVTPATGYHVKSVSGCGSGTWDGIITGGAYTTGAITKKCTVTAAFEINKYIITPIAGQNGNISPNAAQNLRYNTTKNFRITPSAGFQIDSVTGCNGTLNGNYYTTGAIVSDCTITATFKQ